MGNIGLYEVNIMRHVLPLSWAIALVLSFGSIAHGYENIGAEPQKTLRFHCELSCESAASVIAGSSRMQLPTQRTAN